ncbi:MAG: 5-(carboxyamino)imidazole ribonucleotide synthase [Gammaproteobacteria bacterium]|nr:5-(carboxyamino)imidazole ribonucleotide synthase [Gammaproteobacteria bacterium]NNC77960.1 5-(carboxyamino)imidazole ribonucleotide synthase [Woeseiaceae bacterium]
MRIGIIGAGQLGQMLGMAARELDYECRFLDPAENPPAATTGKVIGAAFDDPAALRELAEFADVLTYEFENVPVDALSAVEQRVTIYPPPDALRFAQDRLVEKTLFETLDIPLPGFCAIDNRNDLDIAATDLGLPMVIKTRRFGYDGKGQKLVRTTDELDDAWQFFQGRDAIAEAWVKFDFEVSIIGARNPDGETVVWPLTMNEHVDGILHTSRAPLDNPALAAIAETYVVRLLEHLNYVGVIALELFVVGNRLLANEFAPRVHNSGHWTIEGSETSQFLNHLLTITGRAPRSTAARGHAGMLNLIGRIPAGLRQISGHDCVLHDYGKVPRPGRKLGHLTVISPSGGERDARLAEFCKSVTQLTPL